MRILVNDIAASSGGALSVLKDFYAFVRNDKSGYEWIFLLSDAYVEETDKIKVVLLPEVKKSHLRKMYFDYFSGRKLINSYNPDLVISLQNVITRGVKAKQTVYVHQALPFQSVKNFSFFKSAERSSAVYQHLIGAIIKHSIKRADAVVVQTQWMKKAVVEKTNIDEDKILVIPPKIDTDGMCFVSEEFKNTEFFYPTANAVYKNVDCIYEACRILNERNVFDFKVELTLPKSQLEIPQIVMLDKIDRRTVFEKYSEKTLVFPSYIESFGLPLAEARRCGTVILAADTPFSREILDGYKNAYFFDAFKPSELADLMQKLVEGRIKKEITEDAERENSNGWKEMVEFSLRAIVEEKK